jgi:hypothetical protein
MSFVTGQNVTSPRQKYYLPVIAAPDIQVFSTPGNFTWTKPAGASLITVTVIGGGGGGGGGAPASTNGGGGGGGAGGAKAVVTYTPSQLGATEPLTVGAGGAGAVAQSVGPPGNDGQAGAASTFGTGTRISSPGGGQGHGAPGGGGTGGTSGGAATVTSGTVVTNVAGPAGGNGNQFPGAPGNGTQAVNGTGSGAGGSGINGPPQFSDGPGGTGPGGSAGGASIMNGTPGGNGVSGSGGGAAGSDSATHISITSGQGGDGASPGNGGGGSGGAWQQTFAGVITTAAKGGNGAAGQVIVVTTFGAFLGPEGTVTGSWAAGTTLVLPGLNTSNSKEPIIVFGMQNGASISSVTSPNLVFTRRATTGGANPLEEWTASSANPLVNEVITITYSVAPTFGRAAAFGVSGTPAAPPVPFDTNASLPVNNTVAADPQFSTTAANTIVLAAMRFVVTGSPTPGAGWTAIANVANSFFLVEYQVFTSAQSNTTAAVATGHNDENGSLVDALT